RVMRKRAFDAPDWYRALTLSERATFLRSVSDPVPHLSEPSEVIRHRRETWKSQSPFGTGDWLVRRLAQEGLDETSFGRLLGVPAEYLQSIAEKPPRWLAELEAAFSVPSPGASSPLSGPAPGAKGPKGPKGAPLEAKDPAPGFIRLLTPALRRA